MLLSLNGYVKHLSLSLPDITVPAQRHVQVTSPTLEEEEDVKEVPATPTSATPLPEELLSSPALRFITRRDLYTFLNKAGVSSLHIITVWHSAANKYPPSK